MNEMPKHRPTTTSQFLDTIKQRHPKQLWLGMDRHMRKKSQHERVFRFLSVFNVLIFLDYGKYVHLHTFNSKEIITRFELLRVFHLQQTEILQFKIKNR